MGKFIAIRIMMVIITPNNKNAFKQPFGSLMDVFPFIGSDESHPGLKSGYGILNLFIKKTLVEFNGWIGLD